MPALFIFALLIGIPIMEIVVFILVGGQLGIALTLGLILLTAIIGTFLLRHQGLATLQRIQSATAANELPATSLIHGLLILIAGVLLLTPGFVTDSLGFLLFVPPVRAQLINSVRHRMSVQMSGTPNPPDAEPVIDLDAADYHAKRPDQSPWRDDDTKPQP